MDAVVTTLRTVSLFAEIPREVLARLVSEFTVAVRFALPWQTAVPLLTVALTPFAQAAGLSPFIMALVALKAGNVFLLRQQSPYYLTLYYGTKERASAIATRGRSPGSTRRRSWQASC
jgi:hypothetical protein